MPEPRPKTYKTAKRILQESLADIEAGEWCTGALLRYGEQRARFVGGKVSLTEDASPSNLNTTEPITFFEKPQSCALGLIAMYGGLGKLYDFANLGDGKIFLPRYPEHGDHPQVIKALRALAAAVPARTREEGWVSWQPLPPVEEMAVTQLNAVVYHYNDRLTRRSAITWFKKALDSV